MSQSLHRTLEIAAAQPKRMQRGPYLGHRMLDLGRTGVCICGRRVQAHFCERGNRFLSCEELRRRLGHG